MSFSFPISILIAVVYLLVSTFDSSAPVEEVSEADLEAVAQDTVIPSAATSVEEDTTETLAGLAAPMEESMENPGYRVQVFSTSLESKAIALANRLKGELIYGVNITYADGEWKVRVGNFYEKYDAQLLCDEFKAGEFSDAWVARCSISPLVLGFRIQMSSLSSEGSALAFARLVGGDSRYPVYVMEKNGAWKVRVGDFLNNAEAETAKREMAERGYIDMWIVEDRVYR